MKKLNKKGFTLAELLIVVAIIAVLVAIAIPVFSAQLEKSREATDLANVRGAYSELVSKYLTDSPSSNLTATVAAKQMQDNWQSDGNNANTKLGVTVTVGTGTGTTGAIDVPFKKNGSNYTLTITPEGVVTVS